MNWRHRLRLYLLALFAVGSVSLYLAYGPFTSDAWYWAFGGQPESWDNHGGHWEWLRLALLCLLFYLVAGRRLAAITRLLWSRSVVPRPLFRWRKNWFGVLALVLWAAGLVGVPLLHVWILPRALDKDFSERVVETQEWPGEEMQSFSDFERAKRPYLLYLPYSLTTYVGIAIPAMLMIVVSIRNDRRRLRRLLRGLRPRAGIPARDEAVRLRSRVDRVYDCLQTVMERYSWVLFLLALYYAVEVLTRMFSTLSCIAQAATAWSAWIFALVVVPYFFLRTYRRYRKGSRRMREAARILRRQAEEEADSKLLDEVQKIARRIEPDSMVGYLKLISRTRAAYVLTALLALGLAAVFVDKVTQGDPRPLINLTLPPPVDEAAIWTLDQLAPSPAVGSSAGFHYQACFENYAPVSEVITRFRQP